MLRYTNAGLRMCGNWKGSMNQIENSFLASGLLKSVNQQSFLKYCSSRFFQSQGQRDWLLMNATIIIKSYIDTVSSISMGSPRAVP